MHSRVSAIVALDEKNGIGKDKMVPWHIKEDLVRLKNLSLGHVVILGRTTYESMLGYYSKSGKPTMSQRTHIVVTSDKDYEMNPDHGFVAHSPEEALEKAKEIEQEEIIILGGAKIFQQMLKDMDRLYLTLVKGDFDCDTFFPDYSEFTKVIEKEEHFDAPIPYTFLTLDR